MSYETVAHFSQVSTLLFFIALLIGVLAYALWPGNGKKFDDAQRHALDLDVEKRTTGGRQ